MFKRYLNIKYLLLCSLFLLINCDNRLNNTQTNDYTLFGGNIPLKDMECSWVAECKSTNDTCKYQIKQLYILNFSNDEIILTVDKDALIMNKTFEEDKIFDLVAMHLSIDSFYYNNDDYIDYKFKIANSENYIIYVYDNEKQFFYKKRITD